MARQNGPITICVINLKGGVGKSTIAALLSRHAFFKQLDVLAVDLDPQANLSQALLGTRYNRFLSERRASIVEIFNGYQPPNTTTSTPQSLSPDTGVETIGRGGNYSLDLIPSRFDFSDQLTHALRPDPRVLARYIASRFIKKDLIFIDCAPTESLLTHAAYHASGKVLVPVKPEFFATVGFPLLNQSLINFRNNNYGHIIDVAGIVINNAFYDGGNNGGPEKTASLRDIREEAAKNSWKIFSNEIPFSRGFPKLMRGDYSYSGNADMFHRFADEFFREIGV